MIKERRNFFLKTEKRMNFDELKEIFLPSLISLGGEDVYSELHKFYKSGDDSMMLDAMIQLIFSRITDPEQILELGDIIQYISEIYKSREQTIYSGLVNLYNMYFGPVVITNTLISLIISSWNEHLRHYPNARLINFTTKNEIFVYILSLYINRSKIIDPTTDSNANDFLLVELNFKTYPGFSKFLREIGGQAVAIIGEDWSFCSFPYDSLFRSSTLENLNSTICVKDPQFESWNSKIYEIPSLGSFGYFSTNNNYFD